MRLLLLATAALCAAGCGGKSQLNLQSFADPHFPDAYVFQPTECAQWTDSDGDLHVVATASRLGSGPGAKAVTQYLHIHMFWTPSPGKTPVNATAMDATLRYVVLSPEGAGAYTGTGFVYTKQPRFGPLQVDLERAELRFAEHTPEFQDMLGEMRVSGRLRPANDKRRAVSLIRQSDVAVAAGSAAAQ